MKSQQSLTKDDVLSSQTLDVETVCEKQPAAVEYSGHSIIQWHVLWTIFRFLKKIIFMPFSDSLLYVELTGMECHSNEHITVIYIGDKSNYEYVVSLIFNSTPQTFCKKRIQWWVVNREIKLARKSADLLIADIDFPLNLFIKKQGALVLPRWLKQKIDIADRWQDVLAKLRRKTRREAFRSIRKYNLKARVVRDVESNGYFYQHLYKPYIQSRYGHQAALVSEQRFLSECAHGQQIQILQDNKILAAVLVHISGNQLTLAWTGIDKNVEKNQLTGVADALDLYSLMYAYTQGCSVMDMGGSRPLINDGVLRYKRKWGSAISLGLIPKGNLFYFPCKLTPSVESFLENNPMVIKQRKKLFCVNWVFARGDCKTSVNNINQSTELFSEMYQFGLDEFYCFNIVEEDKDKVICGETDGLPYKIHCISRSRMLTDFDFSL